jgi:hypothetical protein
LARIRREEGEAAADAAIAKRTQLQNEAELVRQLLLDLRKAESGS